MPHSFGYRARTRYMFQRAFKDHGMINMSTYMAPYKVRVNPSSPTHS
jgi:large subunit ribosomal protein L21e